MKILALLATMAAFGAAHAADVRPLLKTGFDLGGEALVNVVFTNGDTQKVRGNEGFYFGGGAAIISDAKDWEYDVTLAYKFAVINGSNGDVDWTRIPFEALAFYRLQHVRFGGGLTYHLSPRLKGSGVVGGLDVKFKNALGVILQADWRITQNIALGGRFTFLEYDAKAPASGSAEANGFGVTFGMNF